MMNTMQNMLAVIIAPAPKIKLSLLGSAASPIIARPQTTQVNITGIRSGTKN
jgi:hypothetical protein